MRGTLPATARLRGTVPMLFAAAAAIHLSVAGPHAAESKLHLLFFVAVGLWQAAWAVVLIVRPSRRALISGMAGSGLILLVWIASRTTGLPVGPERWAPEVVGPADLLSSALEATAILGCRRLLWGLGARIPRPAVARAAMRSASGLAVLAAASLSVGGHAGHAAQAGHGGHPVHLAAIGAAAVLFAVYLALFVWVNGRPAFSWRLGPALVR